VSRWPFSIAPLLCACSFDPEAAGGDGGGTVDASTISRCDAPGAFADGLTPASTIFVAPTTTGTPDGSMEHPFTSLEAALAGRTPGTRVLLQPGTYPGEVIDTLRGTATSPFWIEGPSTGPRAVFTSPLQLVRPHYLVVRHLDLAPATGAPFTVDDAETRVEGTAHHVAIDDLRITGPANANCVLLAGVDDVSVARIETTGCTTGVRMVGVHRAVLTRLRITSPMYAGVIVAGGSDRVDIRQSVILDPGTRAIWLGGASDENEFRPPLTVTDGNFEVANVRVLNNVIVGDQADAIPCSLCREVLVAGNLIMGSWARVGRLIAEHGAINGYNFLSSGKMRWINNAVDVLGNATPFQADGGTELATVTFSHNLWNNTTAPPAGDPAMVLGMPSGYDTTGRLCAGAAAHAGITLPELEGTLEGDCRPDPPSIGPDEPGPGC